ncbi:MAG: ATP-dependent DNA helicase [Deltaproteobacteria bacterium]|nr:ATP-dependent DNA helicase [Deltaproteobacteria bacterium]
MPIDWGLPDHYILCMPPHNSTIQEILGPEGTLAHSLEHFEFRPSQLGMAQLIGEAILHGSTAALEAGTGTGKTLAYLVPLVLSEKVAVISTGTKNLQEQIFFKDIPLLSKALGRDIDAMLMKGRKNYLCLYRYRQHFVQPDLLGSETDHIKEKLDAWLKKTEYADRAELPWLRDDAPLWDDLSSTSEQCLGAECMHWEDCYLNAVRRRALQSRLIIVNHHLFFADLMVKKGGFGEIIPRFEVLLFDEAHTIEDIATTYLGESLSSNQLMDFTDDLEKAVEKSHPSEKQSLKQQTNLIRAGAEHLKSIFYPMGEKGQLEGHTLQAVNTGPLPDIKQGIKHLLDLPLFDTAMDHPFQTFVNRAEDLIRRLEKILSLEDPDWLKWYEMRKRGVVLHASPLDISRELETQLYQKIKTIVFTSATLSTNGNFDYLQSRLGLPEDMVEGIFPSHFSFETQTLMFIPRDLPPPNDSGFARKIASKIKQLLKLSSGRALVLFTSYHNLNLVDQALGKNFPYAILKQGDAPRSVLLEQFRTDTHSVLLATGSFWQGVDVPGEALSCLIIDKLPFDSPGDPLVAARIELIRKREGNPFMEYQLPSAIIALKQGLGRLIRNNSDSGIIAILDIRIMTARYGRFFFSSLPDIPLSHELWDVNQFFDQNP